MPNISRLDRDSMSYVPFSWGSIQPCATSQCGETTQRPVVVQIIAVCPDATAKDTAISIATARETVPT